MARLKATHKRFIVKRLAVFDRPSDVRDALRDRHGIEVDLSQLAHYDPTTSKGQRLAPDWKELFHRTRERFLEDFTGSAIQHKAVRLRELQKQMRRLRSHAETLEDMGNVLGAADMEDRIRDLLKQVAKEMGGKYTNHSTTDITNTDNIDWDKLTDEQLERIVAGEPIHRVLADAG
jgi:hypothetical protein